MGSGGMGGGRTGEGQAQSDDKGAVRRVSPTTGEDGLLLPHGGYRQGASASEIWPLIKWFCAERKALFIEKTINDHPISGFTNFKTDIF